MTGLRTWMSLLVLSLGGSAAAQAPDGTTVVEVEPPQLPAAPDGQQAYRVGPRDVISLEVVGEPELSRKIEVQPTGDIEVPMVGVMSVKGLTTQELAQAIRAALASGYILQPQVLVEVVEYRSQAVQVHGAVQTPGTYYLEGPTRLSELISMAGSVVQDGAAVSQARILRKVDGNLVTLTVNLERVFSGDPSESDPYLLPDDVVRVPEEEAVFVQGEVDEDGLVPFREGMTASQAVTAAGGALSTAKLKDSYILRDGQRIPLNLKKVIDGTAADITLQPGDQIVIPESVF